MNTELQTTDEPLAIVPVEQDPGAMMRHTQNVAAVCQEIVANTSCPIQGKNYIKVEGWQAIATAHGCVAGSRDVTRTPTGYSAIGEIRKISDGTLIAQAEGFVGDDENAGLEYARRAKAQTRAISRAGRAAFAHVVVLMRHPAGGKFETTPADEVPPEGFGDSGGYQDTPKAPKTPQKPSGEAKTYTLKPEIENIRQDMARQGTPEDWEKNKREFIDSIVDRGYQPQAWAYAVEAGWILPNEPLDHVQPTMIPKKDTPDRHLVSKMIRETKLTAEQMEDYDRVYGTPEGATPEQTWNPEEGATMATQAEIEPEVRDEGGNLKAEEEDQIPGAEMPSQVAELAEKAMAKALSGIKPAKPSDKWKEMETLFQPNSKHPPKGTPLGQLDKGILWWWVMVYEPKAKKDKNGRVWDPKPTDIAWYKRLQEFKPWLVSHYKFTEPKS